MRQNKDVKVICAWCNKTITEGLSDIVSHGMCSDCYSKMNSKSPMGLKDFLDKLVVPVLVVQDSGRTLYANNAAEALLGKNYDEINGELGGDVFECTHSKKPGGCGGTTHCKACTIRQSVEHTFQTGESLYDIPATLKIKPSDVKYNIHSSITTVCKQDKEGKNFVYLTIRDFVREPD